MNKSENLFDSRRSFLKRCLRCVLIGYSSFFLQFTGYKRDGNAKDRNIMSQYTPVYKAKDYPEIARRITKEEYREAIEWAKKAGLTRLDIQGDRFL